MADPSTETDVYGVDVRLTDDGDLLVGPTGGLIVADGPENVAQALVMRMRTWPGELPLHLEYGSTLERELIGSKGDPDLARGVATRELRAAIEADRRLLSARNITATVDAERPNAVAIGCSLQLAEGDELDIADLAALSLDQVTVTDPTTLPDTDLDGEDDSFLAGADIDLDENPDIEDLLGDDMLLDPALEA